ncbi:hypothetical protein REH81_03690 [Vibrio rotiferianus]
MKKATVIFGILGSMACGMAASACASSQTAVERHLSYEQRRVEKMRLYQRLNTQFMEQVNCGVINNGKDGTIKLGMYKRISTESNQCKAGDLANGDWCASYSCFDSNGNELVKL